MNPNRLNLAHTPFGYARAFWLGVAVAAGALVLGAVLLGLSYWSKRNLPPEVLQTRVRLQQQLQELATEEAALRAKLTSPETMDVYDRSFFLNQLLTRKGVSWTRTFGDIEDVLPPRVLMMLIRPEVTADNAVQLEMQVGAETWDDFIRFVEALEQSDKFDAPNVRGYNPPNDNEPYFRFQLVVRYAQQL